MKNEQELKSIVKEKYTEVVEKNTSCCGPECGCTDEVSFMQDDYQSLPGYNPEADLGLGCGLPTELANIKSGDTVIDLGSGAGNDCFVARSLVGSEGKVIGIDFTPKMIQKAKENATKIGYENVHFVESEIENMPLPDNTADVVVSNCVLNLVPNKTRAFQEAFRIIKPGGHFSISDVVIRGNLPEKLKESAEMYVGCVSGAIDQNEYLEIVKNAGFTKVDVQRASKIALPKNILAELLTQEEQLSFNNEEIGIYSITVYGEKPEDCCDSNCCN